MATANDVAGKLTRISEAQARKINDEPTGIEPGFDDAAAWLPNGRARYRKPIAGGTLGGLHLYKTSNQSYTNNNQAAVTWDDDRYDVGGRATFTSTQVTIVTTGYYDLLARAAWANNTNGSRTIWIIRDPSGAAEELAKSKIAATTVGDLAHECSTRRLLTAGDVLEVQAHQSSGSTINLTAAQAEFSLELMRT